MNNRLEQFVRDHREEFDTEEPDNNIWDKISRDLDPGKKKQASVIRMQNRWIRWSAAAILILLVGGGALWYLKAGKGHQPIDVAHQGTSPNSDTNNTKTTPDNLAQTPVATNPPTDKNPELANTRPDEKSEAKEGSQLDASVNEEMYHYAKLVEIKHRELKAIKKDEPLLYKQFAADVDKLDSVYHGLQEQLPKNPNREQILEAMLQNLQLQMGLLNHQLDIIRQINHSKKTEYEKAYKTT